MKDKLKLLGLTEGEIAVYLTLLKLGESTNGPLARHSGLQSSTVYYCLNNLVEKGFVTYVMKGERKHFNAVSPRNITIILEEQEKELAKRKEAISKIIPELESSMGTIQNKTLAEVYEGINGLRALFKGVTESLKKGECLRAFTIEQGIEGSEALSYFLIQTNQQLNEKGVYVHLIAPSHMRTIFEKIYSKKFLRKYSVIKYTNTIIPVGITITKDSVITHIFEDNKIIAIKIKNEKLASMYCNYFEQIWKSSIR